jgi:cobalt-zinc-cadmium efflux system outer membrane protein
MVGTSGPLVRTFANGHAGRVSLPPEVFSLARSTHRPAGLLLVESYGSERLAGPTGGKWWRPMVVAGCALFVASTSMAADLSLEGAVQAALMGNRDLAAARFAVKKAEGRLRQAGLLPNPEIEFSGFSDFVGGGEGEGEFTIGLHQMLPLTARLGIAREVSRVGVAEALREVRNHERLLVARVQELYVQVLAAGRRASAAAEARIDARELGKLAGQRLAAGQGSLAESALARVDEQRWLTSSTAAATEAETLRLELKTALGLAADAPLELTQSLESVVEVLQARAATTRPSYRPDVEMALLALDRAGAETRLAKASAWEGVRVGVEYLQDRGVDAPAGIDTGHFLGVKVSLPLPVWDRKTGEIEAGRAAEEQRAAQVRALELEVANGIAAARRRAGLFDEQWRVFGRETQPVIADAEQEMVRGFEEGRVDARDLLMVRAQNASLRAGSADILASLALALIELEAAAGTHPVVAAPYLEESPPHRKK